VSLEFFSNTTTVQPLLSDPIASAGGETNSVSLTTPNAIERYLNAPLELRRRLLPEIPKTEDTVKQIIALSVFSRQRPDADNAVELLSNMGWQTYSFAVKYSGFSRYLRPIYSNYVWELLARGFGYAEDIELNDRCGFLRDMAKSSAKSLAYIAKDVLSNLTDD
jgi:hypothetical protein